MQRDEKYIWVPALWLFHQIGLSWYHNIERFAQIGSFQVLLFNVCPSVRKFCKSRLARPSLLKVSLAGAFYFFGFPPGVRSPHWSSD
uniref:Putative ovule protein n=1 Tax=Solanum chacoense TaxID=4108 RepID=A0A0V0H331_SOLCH